MEPFTTPIEHLEVFELWKQTFTPEDPDPEIFLDPEMIDDGKSFEISSTFDYDLSDKDYVLLFCDITIRLPRIAIQAVRCSFKVNLTDFTDMFILENLRHPVSLTIFYAFDALKDICDEANLPFPSELDPDYPNVDDATLNAICNDMINIFRHHRAPFDMENKELMLHYGLTFTTGWEMKNLLILTFSVIEELIHTNTAYNRLHNRKVFFNEVPEMRYNSLRLKCEKIREQDIDLTDLESIFFLKCVGCTVNILLSDKGDRLQSILKEWGANAEVLKYFYKSATKVYEIYHKPYVEKFLNAPKPDWEKLIS